MESPMMRVSQQLGRVDLSVFEAVIAEIKERRDLNLTKTTGGD